MPSKAVEIHLILIPNAKVVPECLIKFCFYNVSEEKNMLEAF